MKRVPLLTLERLKTGVHLQFETKHRQLSYNPINPCLYLTNRHCCFVITFMNCRMMIKGRLMCQERPSASGSDTQFSRLCLNVSPGGRDI